MFVLMPHVSETRESRVAMEIAYCVEKLVISHMVFVGNAKNHTIKIFVIRVTKNPKIFRSQLDCSSGMVRMAREVESQKEVC